MENWIGAGVWIVLGGLIGFVIKILVAQPETTPGHTTILIIFGAFGALVGGMLGVGLFHFHDPVALSAGGMGGAIVVSAIMTWTYRWGVRGLI